MSKAAKLLKNESKKNEELDASGAIKALIDTNFSASEEEKGKAAQLLRGIFFSEEPEAQELIKKLDAWFTSLDSNKE